VGAAAIAVVDEAEGRVPVLFGQWGSAKDDEISCGSREVVRENHEGRTSKRLG